MWKIRLFISYSPLPKFFWAYSLTFHQAWIINNYLSKEKMRIRALFILILFILNIALLLKMHLFHYKLHFFLLLSLLKTCVKNLWIASFKYNKCSFFFDLTILLLLRKWKWNIDATCTQLLWKHSVPHTNFRAFYYVMLGSVINIRG